jgi:hypothetical protein
MKRGLGLSNKEMGDIFTTWNKGVLDSFLIEITRDIMYYNDDDGKPLLEKIMDSAGQKGTGKWTAINALDLGMPVTLIGEAVSIAGQIITNDYSHQLGLCPLPFQLEGRAYPCRQDPQWTYTRLQGRQAGIH